MDPPELASEPAPCYARRGRIERSHANVGMRFLRVVIGCGSRFDAY